MSTKCPICGFENARGAARCDKCKAWLVQSAELPPPVGSAPAPAVPKSAAAAIDPEMVDEILALVRDGRKIEAIRIFRETTGCGLREAKDAVEAMEAGRQTLSEGRVPPPPATMEENEILELVRAGNIIAAIKLHRERTGDGLKESKEAVEALARAHGIARPQQVGCGGAALMLVVGFVMTVVLGAGLIVFGKVVAAKFGL
ncbi:MAG: ribosomal protein L7/L12 [Planctomycetaceae bacterium]|nr:ribosomal protein L7/L12 [Planctomycetaceae bacterium]